MGKTSQDSLENQEMADVRIDQWLWAARRFKTRSLAQTACNAGHVKLNGDNAKPAKAVKIGDRIEVRIEHNLQILEVAQLGKIRGPATVAQTLYIDHTPKAPPPEMRTLTATRDRGEGRPTKRDGRELRKLRGR